MAETPANDGLRIGESDIGAFVMASTRERYQRLSWQGGFMEYLARVKEDPYRHTRTAYQLLRDMLLHYGVEEVEDNGEGLKRYRLFTDPFDGGKNEIFGLERSIQTIVNYIEAAAQEQGRERILILHGPVGTAKTSLIDMLACGLEHYTATAEGEVYTFAWRFGKDFNSDTGGGLGFGARETADYAGVRNPVAVLPSQMHEHPLLLVPRTERRALLEDLFRRAGIAETRVIPHKILEADLDYNSKQIYNYLIRRYDGNWAKVMDHVLIQRVQFSESAGLGIAKIPPEGNVETASQPVTVDENFRFISNLITSINLVRFHGKYVKGNRGIVHYSDMFKKPANYLQHLLGAVEEHKMDFGETGCDIDCAIIGTSNIHEFLALRQDPISRALRSRIRKVDIPYLRNYRDEERIYLRGLRRFRHRLKIAPHTTEMAARWAVMTRLEPSALDKHEEVESDVRAILGKLTPLDKAQYYAGEFPAWLSVKERQKITPRIRKLLYRELKYEGMGGAPTRTLQDVFANLCEESRFDCITPFRIFDLLEQLIEQGPENLDFLARDPEGSWFDVKGFVLQLRAMYDQVLRHEIERAIVDVDDRELEARIRTYLRHVTAYNRKEQVRNPVSGRDEPPDEQVMKAIEKAMRIPVEDKDQFRFKILSRATNAALAGGQVNVREVYGDLYEAVHAALFEQRRSRMIWTDIEDALEKSPTLADFRGLVAGTPPGKYATAETLVRNLETSFGYDYECARVSVLYFIRSIVAAT